MEEQISKLIDFFENFKTNTRKNLSRKERTYYLSVLEELLGNLNIVNIFSIQNIPWDYWELFFEKINILDRNYRYKYKTVYDCYKAVHSVYKKLEPRKKSSKRISNKKFIKSITSIVSKENTDDILIDNIFEKNFSIKQLFKLFHILNISLRDNDYRRDILLQSIKGKLNNLITSNAKKVDTKNIIDYYTANSYHYIDSYPIDKNKDIVSYIHLKHPISLDIMSNWKDREIRFEIKKGKIENSEQYLSNKSGLIPCSIFNCNIPSYICNKYSTITISNIRDTFKKDDVYFVSKLTITAESDCSITFKIREKNKLGILYTTTKLILRPLELSRESIWTLIFEPKSESFVLCENLPTRLTKLNSAKCARLINSVKNSGLSLREIFNRDDLSGNITEISELMNKNK